MRIVMMKKLTILFPGNYMDYRVIDDMFRDEYRAVEETGLFDVILFNYDEWLSGGRLRLALAESITGKVIYRGWMLKPEEYGKLCILLRSHGLLLLTEPSEYANLHLFPRVYPFVINDTARTIMFPDGKVNVEAVKEQFRRFMVKDFVKSVKGTEFPVFFDRDITQETFDEWMKVFYKYRGNLLTGGICIKEYLDLKCYGDRTNEFRVFYANHQAISIFRNSRQPTYSAEPPKELIERYRNLNSPYYSVDYAELSDGTWKIIETGDGGVSGLSPGQDHTAYYRSLYYALRE